MFNQQRFSAQAQLLRKDQSSLLINENQTQGNEPIVESQHDEKIIQFVKQRPFLKQIYDRNRDDGLYPKLQSPTDYKKDDLNLLIKHNKLEILPEIVSTLTPNAPTSDAKFLTYFASLVYDRDHVLMTQLYNKMKELELPISSTLYNYFLWSAVQFNDFQQTMQLLFEVTILNVKVDINTYVKLFSGLYYDGDVRFDRKEFLMYLYALFENDHTQDCFNFGTELFQEYIDSNITEFSMQKDKISGEKPLYKPKSRKNKQANQPSLSQTNEEDQEENSDETEFRGDHQRGMLNAIDQMEELFQNRSNLFQKEINRSKNHLKRHNSRKYAQQHGSSQSNKHLLKYQNQQQNQNNETQLIVELGSLKNFDNNPHNIKELSRMMADQIAVLLNQEINESHNRPENGVKINHYKVDLVPLNYQKKPKPKQERKIRDEKFSMGQFYGKDYDGHQSDQPGSDKYLTTQEEASDSQIQNNQRAAVSPSIDKTSYDTDEKEEDLQRKTIIREELKENDKGKVVKDDGQNTTADEIGSSNPPKN